jgi:integrase
VRALGEWLAEREVSLVVMEATGVYWKPVFYPKADEPTPKFLDDPTAARFMAALAADPNRRRRLIVELLARTSIRAGEPGGLRNDAMYRLGDTYWLRIPLGKLHNDRSVRLHPLLVINDYKLAGTHQDRPARRTRRPPAL